MTDVRLVRLAATQFNRVSRAQLDGLGYSENAIRHRLASGRLIAVHAGVFAVAPILEHDEWGRWMAVTLTAPGSVLSHVSAAAAWEIWSTRRDLESVTRPGSGGPRRLDGVLVFRSSALAEQRTVLRGIPITTVPRTLLDLAAFVSVRALARALREAMRLRLTTSEAIAETLGAHPGRRGSRRLSHALARYAGLPLERARSGAEVRALEILRGAGLALPRLNVRIAGEEADLSWPRSRLIVEIDGGPFHLDQGEDRRKQARWERAGWTVRRVPSDDVYENPERLLAAALTANVPETPA